MAFAVAASTPLAPSTSSTPGTASPAARNVAPIAISALSSKAANFTLWLSKYNTSARAFTLGAWRNAASITAAGAPASTAPRNASRDMPASSGMAL